MSTPRPFDSAALVRQALDEEATTIHVVAGLAPMLRVAGEFVEADFARPDDDDVAAFARWVGVNPDGDQHDVARSYADVVLRSSHHRSDVGSQISVRIIERTPGRATLHRLVDDLPAELLDRSPGLVLIGTPSGPGGYGLEELLAAIRNRQPAAPDVVIVEDVHDHQGMRAAVDAAHSHRVYATFDGAAPVTGISTLIELALDMHYDPTVRRVWFPTSAGPPPRPAPTEPTPEQHERMRATMNTLADVFRGAVFQVLVPRTDGRGRIIMREYLTGTPDAAAAIRWGTLEDLELQLQFGGDDATSLAAALYDAVAAGLISQHDADSSAPAPELEHELAGGRLEHELSARPQG